MTKSPFEQRCRAISEAELERTVLEMCKWNGWLVTHFRPAKVGDKWMTALSGDAGWPDLAMVHPADKRFAIRELKREDGRLSSAQIAWINGLQAAGVDCEVWRPSDLLNGTIERFVTRISSRRA